MRMPKQLPPEQKLPRVLSGIPCKFFCATMPPKRNKVDSDDEKPAPAPAPAKTKKDKRKGKKGGADSDDDVPEAAPLPSSRGAEPPAAVPQPVKKGKAKKGKGKAQDSDGEDGDVGVGLGKLVAAAAGSDDDAGPAIPQPVKKGKAKKAKGKKKGFVDSDDDDDVKPIAALGAAQADSEEEAEVHVPQPVKKAKAKKAKPAKNAFADLGDDSEEQEKSDAEEAVAAPEEPVEDGGAVAAAAEAPVEAPEPAPVVPEPAPAPAPAPAPVEVKEAKVPVVAEPEPAPAPVPAAGGAGSEAPVSSGDKKLDEYNALKAKEASGVSLSNKERRKLKDLEERYAVPEAVTVDAVEAELANFSLVHASGSGSVQTNNSQDVIAEGFSISAHNKALFVNADLRIVHGRKYGLVGPNGQGKTTLLKHIAARALPVPKNIDVLYVEQEVVADESTAVQSVLLADTVRTALLKREAELLEIMEKADDEVSWEHREELNKELESLYVELRARGDASAEANARKILAGLGFTQETMDYPTSRFSGGWRMRISLARALYMRPTLLLLDEPTNHLDLNAVIWLEEYFKAWDSTILVVSHDQDFLNAICSDIVHLENQKLHYYKGNYYDFKEMHAQHVLKMQKVG